MTTPDSAVNLPQADLITIASHLKGSESDPIHPFHPEWKTLTPQIEHLAPVASFLTISAAYSIYDSELPPFDPASNNSESSQPFPQTPDWLPQFTRKLLSSKTKNRHSLSQQAENGLNRITADKLLKIKKEQSSLVTLNKDDIDALIETSTNLEDIRPITTTIKNLWEKLQIESGDPKKIAKAVATLNSEVLPDIWQDLHIQIRQRLIDKYKIKQQAIQARQTAEKIANSPDALKKATEKEEEQDKESAAEQQRDVAENIILLSFTYPNAQKTIPTYEYKSLFSILKEHYPEEQLELPKQDDYSKEQQYNLLLNLFSRCIKDPGIKLSDDEQSLLSDLSNQVDDIFGEATTELENNSILQARDQYAKIIKKDSDFFVKRILHNQTEPMDTNSLDFALLTTTPPEHLPSREELEQHMLPTKIAFMEAFLNQTHIDPKPDDPKFAEKLRDMFIKIEKYHLYPEKLERAYKKAIDPKRLKPLDRQPNKTIPPLEDLTHLIFKKAIQSRLTKHPILPQQLARDLANSYFKPKKEQKPST